MSVRPGDPKLRAQHPSSRLTYGSPRSSSAILLVEDDAALRGLYRAALRLAGYTVVAVDDGIPALRYLDTDQPSAVVLDLSLPYVSGHDVAKEITAHAETARIPIIVVTGTSEGINPQDFACVLHKPIDTDDLLAAVRECLRRVVHAPSSATKDRDNA